MIRAVARRHRPQAEVGSAASAFGDVYGLGTVEPSDPPTSRSRIGHLAESWWQSGAVEARLADLAPDQGTLDVGVLHRRRSESGIPFVLLVDGCLDHRSYAAARTCRHRRRSSGRGRTALYRPGRWRIALRSMVEQPANYPSDFPWLRSPNATVLGATPRTLAFSVPNPKWLLGAPVATMAERLIGIVTWTGGASDRPSVIRTLSYAAGCNSIGPQELSGTVSWSDWLPHLRRFDPKSFQ